MYSCRRCGRGFSTLRGRSTHAGMGACGGELHAKRRRGPDQFKRAKTARAPPAAAGICAGGDDKPESPGFFCFFNFLFEYFNDFLNFINTFFDFLMIS